MKLIAFIFICILSACSTLPSKYQASVDKKEGYSDKTIDNNLRIATFMGNSASKKDTTELYAKFRAIEVCHEKKLGLAHIMLVRDRTFEKNISQTVSNYPNYYYGMSPYYGRYGAYGMGVGYSTMNTTTSNETYTYPMFDVYFECVEHPVDARMSFKVLSQSQMQSFVKDLKGAVQIDEILPDSPNRNILKVGDIITKANGTRVENLLDLYKASRSNGTDNFFIEFIRDGKTKTAKVKFMDVTEMAAQSQSEIIKDACKVEDIKQSRALCK